MRTINITFIILILLGVGAGLWAIFGTINTWQEVIHEGFILAIILITIVVPLWILRWGKRKEG